MSDNLKKYSFNDLLKQGKVRIPKIQRDYALGRRSQHIDEIRKGFVHTLLLVVKGKRPSTELDFVYGSNQDNAFEPLDGQQRLTTLFLLHWMMGVELSVSGEKRQSLFTYETRNTSDEFCDELVQHDAIKLAKEAKQKTSTPSKIIKDRDWFKWEWKYDPTILSMLVVIDAIYYEMGMDWEKNIGEYRQNLKQITFNLLNLGEFGLSNELFIKMNARGKQLSDFDKLKSTLEEELQIQQKETNEQGDYLALRSDEEMWRTLMDGAWNDLFWHKYARQTIVETESVDIDERKKVRLEVAKLSELQFKKLLLRLIAMQLFEQEMIPEGLEEAAYNLEDPMIDNLLFAYNDSLTELRSDEKHVVVPNSKLTLNFKQLIADVNSLIYKARNDIYYEISNLLPQISHIDKDERSLFDSFLEANVSNDVELTFYAMLLFLRAFPAAKTRNTEEERPWYFDKASHPYWIKNLESWVRATRNILLNENNNQRIDKIQFSKEATMSLKQMAADLVAFVSEHGLNIEDDNYVVKKFLASSDKTYQRLDNQSLAEERLKASLILNDSRWEACFDTAEQHPYLWGQIRCLLNWSDNKLKAFKDYSTKLLELLDFIKEGYLTYYTAMLVFAPNCWEESNRLFQYNKDRDNSFKRYLREHTKEGHTYGINIKALINLWMNSYATLPAKDFLEELIEDKKAGSAPWIQCIVKDPTILEEAWNKRIYGQNGHPIMAQRKTRDSHCFDPILVYFRNICRNNNIDEEKYTLYDSKGEYEHAFQFEKDNHKYFVEWQGTDGHYSIKIDDAESKVYPPEKMIEFMEERINK